MSRRAPHLRRFSLAAVLSALLTFSPLVASRASETHLTRITFSVGFCQNSFLGLNRNDAEAAFKVFLQTSARRYGYEATAHVQVFESAADMDTALESGKVVLFILDSWDYFSLRAPQLLEPQFALMEQGVVEERYLLLTRREGGPKALTALRGQSVALLENANANLARFWLETLLAENRLGPADTFCRKVESVQKASAAVLPVFFGQKPACVVDESAFRIMAELNPQVGRQLHIIAQSEPYLDSLLAFRVDGWDSPQVKADMHSALAELHTEPAGQQILTLFKTTRLVPFQESHLANVRKLRSEHDRWQKEAKARTANPSQ